MRYWLVSQWWLGSWARDPGPRSRWPGGYRPLTRRIGAVSTIQARRWKSLPDTAAWVTRTLEGSSTETEVEPLDPEARRLEALALQLRMAEGVPEALICAEDEGTARDRLDLLVDEGLVERRPEGRIALTRAGKALADPIAAQLA